MSMTAVQQVFGLPELLEQILGYTTFDENGHQQKPAKNLFLLQRVSKGFQATILSSTALRRPMFLSYNDHPDETCRLPQHPAAFWLFNDWCRITIHAIVHTRLPEHRINLKAMNVGQAQYRGGKILDLQHFRSRWDQSASWRRMKIACVDNAFSLSVNFLVHFNETIIDGKRRTFYGVLWVFGGGHCLGEVFDRFWEVCDRSQAEHEEAARAYWSQTSTERAAARGDASISSR